MDRATILQRLALAQEHVARSVKYVANHRARVKRLERRGKNSDHAKKVLEIVEASLQTHIADRDKLEKELKLALLRGPVCGGGRCCRAWHRNG